MKTLKGIVISNKLDKTVTVSIERQWRHPLYKKTIKRNKKYLVDNHLQLEVGDQVLIQETKPISKRKRWKVVEKIEEKTRGKKKKKKKTKKK